MKLINVTNSHSQLVYNQLENTDANMIKVYTIGNTTVIYTDAYKHAEIVLKTTIETSCHRKLILYISISNEN